MTDEELIGYCELHCTTERALFHVDHLDRMLELAGRPDGYVKTCKDWVTKWYSVHEDEMLPLCNLARERMRSNELGHRPETAGGRHGSGGPTGSAPCGPERNSNMDEILKLREELERERMRLAACGVVALANTPDSAEKSRTMHDDYRSASCDDVARAVDRQMALHNALTAVMSYPGVRDYLGRQVSEIADSALMGPNVVVQGQDEAQLRTVPLERPVGRKDAGHDNE